MNAGDPGDTGDERGDRIASPDLLPKERVLPHLTCSRAATDRGGVDEAGEHHGT